MSYLEALILGIVQGLTEFLPVSSSGHLELTKALFGDDSMPSESMTFTVVLHFATALSTVIVFRKDILEIFKGLFQFKWNEQTKFSVSIVLSMIPAVFVGLMFEELLETLFNGQIVLVGFMLLLTSGLLLLADKAKTTDKPVSFVNAIIIGLAQAIAMLPGISRSGATISTSVLLKIDRTKAARFSFLMVIPLIVGKILKDILDGGLSLESSQGPQLLIGFLAAFFAGLFACKLMIALVKNPNCFTFLFIVPLLGCWP